MDPIEGKGNWLQHLGLSLEVEDAWERPPSRLQLQFRVFLVQTVEDVNLRTRTPLCRV